MGLQGGRWEEGGERCTFVDEFFYAAGDDHVALCVLLALVACAEEARGCEGEFVRFGVVEVAVLR